MDLLVIGLVILVVVVIGVIFMRRGKKADTSVSTGPTTSGTGGTAAGHPVERAARKPNKER